MFALKFSLRCLPESGPHAGPLAPRRGSGLGQARLVLRQLGSDAAPGEFLACCKAWVIKDASACVRSNQGFQMLSGLIAWVELFQNTRHERSQTQDRNLQTFWRSVRPDEQDSISTVRPEKMACNWFCGVLVRTFGRGWLQFPIAIRQFSIASDDSGSDFTSLSTMETVARGGRRCACAVFFRVGNRADVVESAR